MNYKLLELLVPVLIRLLELLLSREEVLSMLRNDELKQALMLAPLWRYFAMENQ